MVWEPWTGCYPVSAGCKYCYYYGLYAKRYGQSNIVKTNDFYKPIEIIYMPRKKITKYRIESGKIVYTCFTTDFFLPEADQWRVEAWDMIRKRSDLTFLFLTKRIDRFKISLPDDWKDGYENVRIGCSIEDQESADKRLPLYLSFPIKHRFIVCSPLIGKIDLSSYLQGIESVRAYGEAGKEARECDFKWILNLHEQCKSAKVQFDFVSTGRNFRHNGELKKINPYIQRKTARQLLPSDDANEDIQFV